MVFQIYVGLHLWVNRCRTIIYKVDIFHSYVHDYQRVSVVEVNDTEFGTGVKRKHLKLGKMSEHVQETELVRMIL